MFSHALPARVGDGEKIVWRMTGTGLLSLEAIAPTARATGWPGALPPTRAATGISREMSGRGICLHRTGLLGPARHPR
jgi:hypothetical protein